MDNVSKTRRSEIMKAVKSKDTKPEIIVRKFLFANGFRYRLHDKSLPGKPDIKLTKYKIVVFVNGCFWHGHLDCNIYVMPKTNIEFWSNKIKTNVNRDKEKIMRLQALGWKVITVWECQLKKSRVEESLRQLIEKINRV